MIDDTTITMRHLPLTFTSTFPENCVELKNSESVRLHVVYDYSKGHPSNEFDPGCDDELWLISACIDNWPHMLWENEQAKLTIKSRVDILPYLSNQVFNQIWDAVDKQIHTEEADGDDY